MTHNTLKFMVLQHDKANQNYKVCDYFLEKYVNSKNHLNKLYIFLHKALDYSNFVSRRTYVSPKILGKWKELSIEGTDRIRKICLMKKIMLLYLQVKHLSGFIKQKYDSTPNVLPLSVKQTNKYR